MVGSESMSTQDLRIYLFIYLVTEATSVLKSLLRRQFYLYRPLIAIFAEESRQENRLRKGA